ncbi:MAG: type II toxin-antitoxin system HicA family toxin [Actinomycetota bacterium]|nr:type II toxin-antitoxin system HicA family toxin [Thermaerobacter sp.]MDA8385771.1 type II toxin-antitoxin system HicA family toxin [Actinomycetota bacterium]
MTGKDLIRELESQGWLLDRIEGSHHIMVKAGRRPIPIPVHGSRDLPTGLVAAIRKEARQS